jgi:hypothetical protein
MSWKKLTGDARREAAFTPFLEAANRINGLAITLAFNRDPSFQVPPDGPLRLREALALSANWKPRIFENMFRVAYCTAMLIAGLSNPGQNIHWVSDEDPVFANESFESDTTHVLTELLRLFLPHGLGEIRYNTTAHGQEPLLQEDLVAVPDLMCGATCEIMTAIKRKYAEIPEGPADLPELADRPRAFLDWYAGGPCPLKRYVCTFEVRKGGVLRAWVLPPNLLFRLPAQQA